jgi:hypothetical protein
MPTFGGGNEIRTAPLRTKPYRTLQWKRGIIEQQLNQSKNLKR